MSMKLSKRLDAEIRCCVAALDSSYLRGDDIIAQLDELIPEAKANEIWSDLGFASWTTYLADALRLPLLHPSARERVVALLIKHGVSQRVIARMLNVSVGTVNGDRQRTGAMPEGGVTSSNGKNGYGISFRRSGFVAKRGAADTVHTKVGQARYKELRRIAKERGITLDTLVREAIDSYLEMVNV